MSITEPTRGPSGQDAAADGALSELERLRQKEADTRYESGMFESISAVWQKRAERAERDIQEIWHILTTDHFQQEVCDATWGVGKTQADEIISVVMNMITNVVRR